MNSHGQFIDMHIWAWEKILPLCVDAWNFGHKNERTRTMIEAKMGEDSITCLTPPKIFLTLYLLLGGQGDQTSSPGDMKYKVFLGEVKFCSIQIRKRFFNFHFHRETE